MRRTLEECPLKTVHLLQYEEDPVEESLLVKWEVRFGGRNNFGLVFSHRYWYVGPFLVLITHRVCLVFTFPCSMGISLMVRSCSHSWCLVLTAPCRPLCRVQRGHRRHFLARSVWGWMETGLFKDSWKNTTKKKAGPRPIKIFH